MTLLTLEGVCVDLGGRRVLSDVNLTLEAGTFVGVLGPNGAGKTTLIRAALGLVPLAAGSVRIEGGSVREHRSSVGYVPQRHEFAWDYPISVEDAVLAARVRRAGWLRPYREADVRAALAALRRVDLLEVRSRPVGELSGGQRQRVLVARALALEPRLMLLDEPFTGVDMPTQELLTELFQSLALEGRSVVMSTHDLVAAQATCDELLFINGGLIARGTPDECRSAELWTETFQVSPNNPLLKALEVAC